MKFKRNITITLACVITEFLISLIPVIIMIYLFTMKDKASEMLFTLLVVPLFILIVNAVLIIISLIAQIFMKTTYYVRQDCLAVKTKDRLLEINYDEIGGISYDFGNLTRFNSLSSQLVLFDKDMRQLLSVNNPSIIMVHMIKPSAKT